MRVASWVVVVAIAFVTASAGRALADLPVGTGISATLQSSLDTKTSRAGDPVVLTVVGTTPRTAIEAGLQGATIHGHVSEAVAATPMKKAYLAVAFDTITLADGRSYPFPARIVAFEKKKRTNFLQAAGEILSGMLVGNVAGKDVGTPVGGAIGAMGGMIYAAQMSQDFRIPQDSTVKMLTTGEIAIAPTHPQVQSH
jgi:hypothetical protein